MYSINTKNKIIKNKSTNDSLAERMNHQIYQQIPKSALICSARLQVQKLR